VEWIGPRLHLRRAPETCLRDNARQKSRHGRRQKAEVRDETAASCPNRHEEDLLRQFHRDLQNAPSSAEASPGFLVGRVGHQRLGGRQQPVDHQGPVPAETNRKRLKEVSKKCSVMRKLKNRSGQSNIAFGAL
jgi:hypothetical protein